jgi:hypothetical protein
MRSAWLQRSFGPLQELEAEIRQDGAVCAKAWGKFVATVASDANVSGHLPLAPRQEVPA